MRQERGERLNKNFVRFLALKFWSLKVQEREPPYPISKLWRIIET